MAIMAQRENLAFDAEIRSDTAALHGLAAVAMAAAPGLRLLRDPTRGGLAATLNEIAQQSGVGIVLDLGEEQEVTSVDLDLTGGTTTLELRVPNGSEASMRTSANWNVVATDKVTGSGTIELDEPVSTRYLLVYFTNLPEVDGGYRAEVNEITVR